MSKDREVFAGGVAVITGAGSGIGAGIARRVGELGMTVVVTDISAERAEEVASEIRSRGGKAHAQVVDVSKPAELDRLAADVDERHGEVRLLVNNAGIETLGFIWEISPQRWEATLDVNVHGVVHGVRAFVPRMLERGTEAWIANLSSVGAFGVMPTHTPYIMSKHAVQAFNECLFLELELIGAPIHVSSVIPGMIKTRIFDAQVGEGEPERAHRYRKIMGEMMKSHGMDVDEAAGLIIEQVAQGKFWVSTQPDATADVVAGRIEYLREQRNPALNEETRRLL